MPKCTILSQKVKKISVEGAETAPPLRKPHPLRRLQRLAPCLPTPSYFFTILTLKIFVLYVSIWTAMIRFSSFYVMTTDLIIIIFTSVSII